MRVVLIAPVLALWLAGCPALVAPGNLPSVPYQELPSDVGQLRALADRVHQKSRKVSDLRRARSALTKADYTRKDDYATLWRLARVDGVLARLDDDYGAGWAAEGLKAGARAATLNPDGVEGRLYHAITLGLSAKFEPARADALSQKALEEAAASAKIDPAYVGGEARRVQGAIYLYAPPWPGGVGDLDEAIDMLEALAKDHPEEPLNLFYLAEAYTRADQSSDALRLYRRVLEFPRRGIWGLEGRPYRKQAIQAIRDLRRGR